MHRAGASARTFVESTFTLVRRARDIESPSSSRSHGQKGARKVVARGHVPTKICERAVPVVPEDRQSSLPTFSTAGQGRRPVSLRSAATAADRLLTCREGQRRRDSTGWTHCRRVLAPPSRSHPPDRRRQRRPTPTGWASAAQRHRRPHSGGPSGNAGREQRRFRVVVHRQGVRIAVAVSPRTPRPTPWRRSSRRCASRARSAPAGAEHRGRRGPRPQAGPGCASAASAAATSATTRRRNTGDGTGNNSTVETAKFMGDHPARNSRSARLLI